jgi:hypothetical protein
MKEKKRTNSNNDYYLNEEGEKKRFKSSRD